MRGLWFHPGRGGYSSAVNSSPAPAEAKERTLGDRYSIVRHLARGGMADVYEGRDELLGRRVALKVFRGAAPQDRTRFDAEVRLLARLEHPSLVKVYDAGEHEGSGFVVLELIDGPDLADVLAERCRLPEQEVAEIGAQLAAALAYVHDHDVVHRDVTPANVLCDPDGRFRLADFGIARLVDTSRITAPALTVGTVAYISPEQLEGREPAPAADIYSLGLVLLESLTGRRGFEGSSVEALAARLVTDPDTTTDVPPGWSTLLNEMTSRDPAARPSAATVRGRLQGLAERARTSAAGVAAPSGRAEPPLAPQDPTITMAVGATSAAAASATVEVEPVGGTAVLPAAMRPEPVPLAGRARPGRHRVGRRGFWLLVAAAVAVLFASAAATAGDGVELPAGSTEVTEVTTVTAAPPTTVAPPTSAPPTTAPEAVMEGDDDGGGREEGPADGKGKGRGKDD